MLTNRGFTLVEMIIAIVIIGFGVAGVLTAFQSSVRGSAQPLITKQMLAAAEEMMEEILLKPYAVSGAPPSNSATSCTSTASVRTGFDDVRDYNNYQTSGICTADGAPVAGLSSYNMRVTAVTEAWQGLAVASVVRVTVTVTRGADTVQLVSWRTNYAQ
jgi:MSHA pilin protein MshD